MSKTLSKNPAYVLTLSVLMLIGGGACLWYRFAPAGPADDSAATADAADESSGETEGADAPAEPVPARNEDKLRVVLGGGLLMLLFGTVGVARAILLTRGRDFISDG
jgi:hypothetical protein